MEDVTPDFNFARNNIIVVVRLKSHIDIKKLFVRKLVDLS